MNYKHETDNYYKNKWCGKISSTGNNDWVKVSFEVWVSVLCRLMTPGHSKSIRCHTSIWPYSFLCLQITRSDIRSHLKGAVSLVIADGHLIFLRGLCGYVWFNILTLSPLRVMSFGRNVVNVMQRNEAQQLVSQIDRDCWNILKMSTFRTWNEASLEQLN